jgi:serine protease Do
MKAKRDRRFRTGLSAACGLCIALAAPLHAQSAFWTFPSSTPHQTERLTRSVASTATAVTHEKNGTGFFVDDSGDMLTAGHAATDCSRMIVAKEGHVLSARVIAVSDRVDLALIKVSRTLGLSAVFPRSVMATANDMVFAAAYDTLSGMTTHGGMLANAVVSTGGKSDGYLALDSSVTFGASGAPVLDDRGLIQGVITSRNASNHVLAVDAAEAKAFLAANHVAIDQDDRPQIAATGSRSNRAASISARVTCLQN